MKSRYLYSLMLFLLVLLIPAALGAPKQQEERVELRELVVVHEPGGLAVKLVLSGSVTPQLRALDSPDRVVVDLPNTVAVTPQRRIAVDGDGVKAVRVGMDGQVPPTTRIVVDLARPLEYEIVAGSDHDLILQLLPANHSGSVQPSDQRNEATPAATEVLRSPSASTQIVGKEMAAKAPMTSEGSAVQDAVPTSAPQVEPTAKASAVEGDVRAPDASPVSRPAVPTGAPQVEPTAKARAVEGDVRAPDASPVSRSAVPTSAPQVEPTAKARAVEGDVRAPDSSPVPGATVTLESESQAKPFSSETDEDGIFEFSKVPPGNYVLHVIVPGFEPVGKPVTVGSEPARIRVKLKIAEVSEKVTVSGQTVVMAADNRSQVQFNEHLVMGLPSPNADPLTVPSLFVNPAVVGASGPVLIVDGVETSSLDLPTSSVRSVTVDQNPYSAEFGRPGKGRLEVTTRHGAHHRLRGNVLALFRNSALDARNALALERPLQQREIGEAQLDGPISPDGQTTFFLAGRYHFFNNSAIVDATTPPGLVENNVTTPAGTFIQNVRVPERRTNLFGRIDSQLSPVHKVSLLYKFKNNGLDNQGIGGLELPDRATNVFAHENEVKILETATLSTNFQNQARLTFKNERQMTSSVSAGYGVEILGNADFGSAPTNRNVVETLGDMQDVASFFYGRHDLQFGTGVKLRYFSSEDRSNFGGTLIFSSLSDFESTPPHPLQFKMNFGNPSVDFTDHEVYSFLQDQVRLRPGLSLMLGLRYEFQPNISHYQNLAPRVAAAYSPQATNAVLANTVFRGGFGIFYDRQPYLMQQESLLYNESAIQQIVLSCSGSCPSYRQPLPPGGLPTSASVPSIMTADPNIRFPYIMQGSVAIERKLGRGQNYLTLEFSTMRGVDLYRSRNLNAPLPGTTTPPNLNFVNIDQFEASGCSQSNGLTVTYKGTVHKLNVMAQYVLSRTLDDTSGFLTKDGNPLTPVNNYDPHADWGRSDLDHRHRFNIVLVYPLWFGFHVSGIVNAWSGLPYNITTGNDDNHDTVFNDRPAGLWRNAGRGAGYTDVDLRVSKHWRVFRGEKHSHFVELAWDAFNIFNHANFQSYIGVIISSRFGQPYIAYPARQLQVSARYHF